MLSPVATLTGLTALLALSNSALGRYISCSSQSSSVGGAWNTNWNIPAHKAQFDVGDGRGRCIMRDAVIGDCVETIGKSDGLRFFDCDNGSVYATFWITNDQCLNVEVDGHHHYCCGETLTTDGAAGCSL
ncbi:hypothetical protein IFM53868_09254 [Aspergillus udagawae]|uniref:Cyanovirin-N homolog n=1 Tax=Aspergillus udagawae TaxID=91492 RepID=A0ABQ1BAZ2_9EURO|nr:hypothetical protein IFM53868_09254 [Aspergillus udagawae]